MRFFSRRIWSLLENIGATLLCRQFKTRRLASVVLGLWGNHSQFQPWLWWNWLVRTCLGRNSFLPTAPRTLTTPAHHQPLPSHLGLSRGFLSVTRSTSSICHKFEPNNFCTNSSSFKVPVETLENTLMLPFFWSQKEAKQTKNAKPQPPLPDISMWKEGTTYQVLITTNCSLQSSGINRIMRDFVLLFSNQKKTQGRGRRTEMVKKV